jgi:hypothetical protein
VLLDIYCKKGKIKNRR